MQKLVLDVDTGTDDAVAIMLACEHPDLDLVGITTVNGNVPVAYCTENSLRVLDYIGRSEVPVYEGSATPLARRDFPVPRSQRPESGIHGDFLELPEARSTKQDEAAASYLVRRFKEAHEGGEELILVPTGPLTNIALALKLDPHFVNYVKRVVIMGGGHAVGNVTPAAEFNIWADPEAADVVFEAGFTDLTLVPLDATHEALVSLADCAALRKLGSPAGDATATVVERRIDGYDRTQPMKESGAAPVHDALCVAALVEPTIIDTHRVHVSVETAGPKTVGRTVMDTHHRGSAPPNMAVAFGANRQMFVDMLLGVFKAKN